MEQNDLALVEGWVVRWGAQPVEGGGPVARAARSWALVEARSECREATAPVRDATMLVREITMGRGRPLMLQSHLPTGRRRVVEERCWLLRVWIGRRHRGKYEFSCSRKTLQLGSLEVWGEEGEPWVWRPMME